MEDKIFWCPCSRCKRETRHNILKTSSERGDEHYDFAKYHSIIQCLGCNYKSFQYRFDDIEQSYPTSHEDWETPSTIEYYPKFDARYEEIEDTYVIPKTVRAIYLETMLAIRADALTLGGLGLRGTIEAICNEQTISGKSLDVRITRLAAKGLISKQDAERLHGIRFLGNDAAHDIKKPKPDQLSVAIKIVNHLIQSVYILKAEAEGKLETQISEFDEFSTLLKDKMQEFSKGDELPLAKLLGKTKRRLGANSSNLESELQDQINNGIYKELSIGKVAKYANSPTEVQHYILQ